MDEVISDFERIYPTFELYMERVDTYLEHHCGIGYKYLEDYSWMSAFNDQIEPNIIADDFFNDYPAFG